jgi:hypothetical protein
MQGSLIEHWASQECIPISFQRDRQSIKPIPPLGTEMTLELI